MRPKIVLALDWAIRAFGYEHVIDQKVRALRVVEEAIELAQAVGVDYNKIVLCADVVYSRDAGNWRQEAGGVALTLAVFCGQRGLDFDEMFDGELRRVLAKPVEHFAKRNQEKLDLGLTGA